jgi:hypothetical protein
MTAKSYLVRSFRPANFFVCLAGKLRADAAPAAGFLLFYYFCADDEALILGAEGGLSCTSVPVQVPPLSAAAVCGGSPCAEDS